MNEQSIPVVRLEIQYMKHAILQAFTEHALKLDADVKAAVERFCTPANVSALVGKAVDDALRDAIMSEIDHFYRYGAGRQHVAEAVKTRLEKGLG